MSFLRGKIRKRSSIGLDIGAGGVRAAQLVQNGSRYVVRAAAANLWSPGNSESTSPVVRDSGRMGNRIRALISMMPFRGRRVITGLDAPAVTFQALEIPESVLTDQKTDVDQVIRWEMERLMTDSAEAVATRHWRLPRTQASATTAIGVVAKLDVVLQTVDLCRSAGLTCLGVDTHAAALARFGSRLNDWNADQIWGLLDLGANETRLILCTDDTPILVRRGGGGGQAWNKRIAEALGLSEQAADVHKRDHGIAPSGTTRKGAGPERASRERVPAMLLGALRSELHTLASEIKRSYEYALSCYPRCHASDLVLVGGGATLKQLPEFLGSALEIPVVRASSYLERDACSLQYDSNMTSAIESIASAIGLAIEPG